MDMKVKRPDTRTDRFSASPDQSYTIAARLYHDRDFYEDEQREIFHRSWMFVGHVSDLLNPGDYVTAEFAGQRIYVIRSDNGELKAFFNVCQHRGHSLLSGKGTAKSLIVCPYHAWSYDRNGALIAANNCDHVAGFEKHEFDLPTVAVDTFAGFVFVNLDPNARPMAEVFSGAEEALAKFRVDTESFVADDTVLFDIKGNWKNVGDNLLECYHCAPAHKAFVDLVDMKTYEVETHKYWSIQYGTCRPQNAAYDFQEGSDERFCTLYLWPGLAFAIFPGIDGVSTFSFVPTAPELTHQAFTYFGPSAEKSETEKAAFAYFRDVLGPEDVDLVENVQRGLHSLGYHQGRIMVDAARSELSEHALHHFQNLVMSEMADYV